MGKLRMWNRTTIHSTMLIIVAGYSVHTEPNDKAGNS